MRGEKSTGQPTHGIGQSRGGRRGGQAVWRSRPLPLHGLHATPLLGQPPSNTGVSSLDPPRMRYLLSFYAADARGHVLHASTSRWPRMGRFRYKGYKSFQFPPGPPSRVAVSPRRPGPKQGPEGCLWLPRSQSRPPPHGLNCFPLLMAPMPPVPASRAPSVWGGAGRGGRDT